MFDIGFFELLLIAVVGLVVIGPERLPGTLRKLALYWGRIKRSISDTRQEIEQQIGADDIRRQLHNEEVMQRLERAEAELNKSLDLNETGSPSHQESDANTPSGQTPVSENADDSNSTQPENSKTPS
ncbi:Sec-independent protein translocase protein TatB [Pseudoteredinibacter isoporae]|uniref:Sec-independent protein translocase protein TatB n=1 Tax=Pseudoteredinibacter isoporae TaxID=570281 RepID=A0A7X0JR49_9GAMM|nr:Sec-independent protein translocase protein TatB [Pseudoteredinibacter isoporae]MBB6519846.1 sec-independent protein translocase protein TatB [Pseudoteredinibacter isoporae]NHO85425.1 twin-arginine translocase subunit TatB [Pseudoteredinibacter isoporae]NIB26123.1 twin-arginine translocase subunit TatB [Pseudoteredinibacter isoporae]